MPSAATTDYVDFLTKVAENEVSTAEPAELLAGLVEQCDLWQALCVCCALLFSGLPAANLC